MTTVRAFLTQWETWLGFAALIVGVAAAAAWWAERGERGD